MSKVNSFVNEFIMKLKKRKIEGSKATVKLTAEVLRSFISQKRLPRTNQAGALIDAVNAVGEELIDANPREDSDLDDEPDRDRQVRSHYIEILENKQDDNV